MKLNQKRFGVAFWGCLLIAGGVFLWRGVDNEFRPSGSNKSVSKDRSGAGLDSSRNDALGDETVSKERVKKESTLSSETVTARSGASISDFEDFLWWRKSRQIEALALLSGDPDLPEGWVNYLEGLLSNKRLGRLVRNNIADILHDQETKRADQYLIYLNCLDDREEDPDWQMYCIQHMARSLSYCENPDVVLERLENLAIDVSSPLSRQAVMMLDVLGHDGYRHGVDIEKLITEVLDSP